MASTRDSTVLLVYFATFCILGACISITNVHVDSPMITGVGGWLKCDWDGDGDSIYSVKWYWGTYEFYRWAPKADKPLLVFDVDDFTVDTRKSSKGHVLLKDVTLKATGILRCEVSGEGPTFHTDYKEVKLVVVDLPDSPPIISGSRPLYQQHQDVSLTCTSPRSKPAASLSFYINDERVDQSLLIPQPPIVDPKTGLETAVLGVKFPLRPRLLQKDKVKVKCTAKIEDVYWDSSLQYITADLPQRASRMEERASGSSPSVASQVEFLKGGIVIQLLMFYTLLCLQ